MEVDCAGLALVQADDAMDQFPRLLRAIADLLKSLGELVLGPHLVEK